MQYQVENKTTGVVLWVGKAATKDEAADRAAEAGGYASQADLAQALNTTPEALRADLIITELCE